MITKLLRHGPARYNIAWIYMLTKARGQVSLELALEEKKD